MAMKNKIFILTKLFVVYMLISNISLILIQLVFHHTLIANYNFINDLRITLPISLICALAQTKRVDN